MKSSLLLYNHRQARSDSQLVRKRTTRKPKLLALDWPHAGDTAFVTENLQWLNNYVHAVVHKQYACDKCSLEQSTCTGSKLVWIAYRSRLVFSRLNC